MENNQSLELVKTQILMKANAAAYLKVLQDASKIKITTENVALGQPEYQTLKETVKRLNSLENPFKNDWSNWNKGFKVIADPLETELSRIDKEMNEAAAKKRREKADADAKAAKNLEIQTTIKNKTLEFSNQIAAAKDDNELVLIEKRIASEKNRPYYNDFKNEAVNSFEGLLPALKLQKENVRLLNSIEKQKETASIDDLQGLFERQEIVENEIQVSKSQVQEQAINSALKSDVTPTETVIDLPKSNRDTWSYIITDFEKFKKAFGHLVKCEPDHEKIKLVLKEMKEAKTIKEEEINGLKIFIKSSF
jgi:hypothetical protein